MNKKPVAPAVDAQPVGEIAHNEIDGFHFAPSVHWLKIGIGTKLYATPQSEGLREDAIRREALEEAAKTCDALSTDYNKRRRTSDDPTYMEGKSDGAEACASALYRAIRALSQKEPQ